MSQRRISGTHSIENWKETLDQYGLEYFHMADCMTAKQSPYCDLSEDDYKRLLKQLIATVNLRTRMGFSVGIPKTVYDLFAPDRFKKYYAKDHYTFAVKCCIGLIWRWRMRFGIKEPMQYVFDNVNKGPKQIRAQIGQIWEDVHSDSAVREKYGLQELDGSLFQSKKLFRPLQAADLLAWHMHDYMINCVAHGKDKLHDARPSFLDLTHERPRDLGWFTGPQLVKYFEEMDVLEKTHGIEMDVTQFKGKREWLRQDSEG
jgi:hypothetical protein